MVFFPPVLLQSCRFDHFKEMIAFQNCNFWKLPTRHFFQFCQKSCRDTFESSHFLTGHRFWYLPSLHVLFGHSQVKKSPILFTCGWLVKRLSQLRIPEKSQHYPNSERERAPAEIFWHVHQNCYILSLSHYLTGKQRWKHFSQYWSNLFHVIFMFHLLFIGALLMLIQITTLKPLHLLKKNNENKIQQYQQLQSYGDDFTKIV